jgi:hypothetical protein
MLAMMPACPHRAPIPTPDAPCRPARPCARCGPGLPAGLLIVLGLAWELWLAPTGSGTLALKVLPLVAVLAGLLRHRMYTYRWLSLLVWLYFTEGWCAPPARPACRRPWRAGGGCCAWRCSRQCVHVHPLRWRQGAACLPGSASKPWPWCRWTALCAAVGAAHVLTDGDLSPGSRTGAAAGAAGAGRGAPRAAPPRWPPWSRPAPPPAPAIVPQGGNTGLVGGGVPTPAARRCC